MPQQGADSIELEELEELLRGYLEVIKDEPVSDEILVLVRDLNRLLARKYEQ